MMSKLLSIALMSASLLSHTTGQAVPEEQELPVVGDGIFDPNPPTVGATVDPATTDVPFIYTEAPFDGPTTIPPTVNVIVPTTPGPIFTDPVPFVEPPFIGGVDDSILTAAGQWSSSYSAHNNFMLDQERGTYTMVTYYTSRWSSVSASTINNYKTSYYNTLILMLITLDNFRSSDISATILSTIHKEFQIYRSAGIKVLIRFHYNDVMTSKPWNDASSAAVVHRHIDQLTPILRINEDVIAYVQGGFIGLWGEWYYTDSFGDQATQSATDKANRKIVITKLMAAMPNRAIQVRTPYWAKAFYGTTPLTGPDYKSELGRAGHHNDCYLAGPDDQGTYRSFASEYAYLQQQTKWTPAIFETCATSSRSTCATALKETAELHFVSGHRLYNTAVWNQWISGGCYDTIMKNMGHRLQFVSSTSDTQGNIGSTINVVVNVKNAGYAAPANARKTEVVMRAVDGSSFCIASLKFDARSMQSGTTSNINSFIRLPSNAPLGRYELLFQFADPYSTLYGVPWYKIQAANTQIYEAGTGFHKLNAIVDVIGANSNGANPVQVNEVTAVCGLQLQNLINSTVTNLGTCLGGYYMANGVCTYCPPGSACASPTSAPVACGSGTYSSGGQSKCLACPSTCSGRASCGVKTGACLCPSGWQGYDCSVVAGSSTTIKPPVVVPTTSAPGVPTNAPTTAPPATAKPATGTQCPQISNLLSNPLFGGAKDISDTSVQVASWTAIGEGFDMTVRKDQPSLKLISVSTAKTVGFSQTVTVASPSTQRINFGGYVSTAYVSGDRDYQFALALSLTYTDGTTEINSIYIPTGSYGWRFASRSFIPSKPVAKIEFRFSMTGHTGYAYLTQPVLGIASQCVSSLIEGGAIGAFDTPAEFAGSSILADTGSDADSAAPVVESSSTGFPTMYIIIIAACGGALLIAAAVAGAIMHRKKRAAKLDTAINNQLTAV